MSLYDNVVSYRAPSQIWCILLLITFSYYCYRNIYLQSEIGFKLPPVNLISALNSFGIFADLPSNERFDLYVNLAKTFDAYKDDYMNHYEEYLLLINSYLILDESQIALKYYAYKFYINEEYELNDNFVLGSPIVEFNLNFDSENNNKDRDLNFINKHYQLFGVKNNKESCELFFNNYIYPLFKSQSDWKEVEIAKSMSQVLNHWTLVKRLQITCFALSLSFILFSIITFLIAKGKPESLYKTFLGYTIMFLYSLAYITTVILAFICVSITIVTYNINLNFEGLHNTSFNVLQIGWLLFIGYISVLWVSNFISCNNPLNKLNNDDENDNLRSHINALMNLSVNSSEKLSQPEITESMNEKGTTKVTENIVENGQANDADNEANDEFKTEKNYKVPILKSASIALNSSIKPLVTSLKRLVTPKPAGTAIDFEKIDEEFINYANLDTSFEPFNEEKTVSNVVYYLPSGNTTNKSPTTEIDKIFTKDAFENFKALNLVSSLSLNHPDVSPCDDGLLSYNSSSNSPQSKVNVSGIKNSSEQNSIMQDLNSKRAGFYQHAGLSVNNNSSNSEKVGSNSNNSSYSSKPSATDSGYKFYYGSNSKEIVPKSFNHVGLLKYPIEKLTPMSGKDSSIEWEKKFGLSSAISEAETIQLDSVNQIDSGTSSSLKSSYKSKLNTPNTKEKERERETETSRNSRNHNNNNNNKSSHSNNNSPKNTNINNASPEKKPKVKKPNERKKSNFEYFLPSTMQSEFTQSSAEITTSDKEQDVESGQLETQSIPEQQTGSMFSIERVVNEHRRSM